MAKKLLVVIASICLTVSFQLTAIAQPSNLTAEPQSGTEVQLTWDKADTDTNGYDIWMTKNGNSWQKLNQTSVSGTVYNVGFGLIEPWVNYYFIVTNASFVQNNDPLSTADLVYNSTDIVSAFPPDQSAHGSYKANTNQCALCHRTHTAAGPKLLKYSTVNDTCITCHDGTGSKYNVFTGTVDAGDTTLTSASGPFGNLFNHIVDGNNQPVDIPVISRHSIDTNVPLSTAPGANTAEGTGWTNTFSCASCHDAHGSHNYRMLLDTLPGTPAVNVVAFAETDKANNREKINYRSGMNDFCKACHQRYYTTDPNAGSETVNGSTYMHPVGNAPSSYSAGPLTTSLPLEGNAVNYNDNKMMCLTCHNAHGSNSKTTENNPADTDGGNDAVNYLLRLDYRGVCQDCHKK